MYFFKKNYYFYVNNYNIIYYFLLCVFLIIFHKNFHIIFINCSFIHLSICNKKINFYIFHHLNIWIFYYFFISHNNYPNLYFIIYSLKYQIHISFLILFIDNFLVLMILVFLLYFLYFINSFPINLKLLGLQANFFNFFKHNH